MLKALVRGGSTFSTASLRASLSPCTSSMIISSFRGAADGLEKTTLVCFSRLAEASWSTIGKLIKIRRIEGCMGQLI